MERITAERLLKLPFGSKIKIVWHNSDHHPKNEEYYGVIFGNKIGYEDGKFDNTQTIAECVFNNWCRVYLLDYTITDEDFARLRPVITYDDWTVSISDSGKYYVKDSYMDEIREVVLVHKEKNDIFSEEEVVDFGGDYDGESDDMQWLMSFDIVR